MVVREMYCPYCGAHIDSRTDYCPACGKSINGNRNSRKHGSFLHVFLILVIIASAGLVYFSYSIDLYYNPDPCKIETDFFTKAVLDKMDYGSDYQDTFLIVEDNYYTFFRARDGRLTGCSADESGQIREDGSGIIVKKTGKNYASLTFITSGYTEQYTFRKATFAERLKFISLYF